MSWSRTYSFFISSQMAANKSIELKIIGALCCRRVDFFEATAYDNKVKQINQQ